MTKRKTNPKIQKQKPNGFYWQDDSRTLKAFVKIAPITLTALNNYYWKGELLKTRSLVGVFFLQKNVPRLIITTEYYHWICEYILDDKDAPNLHLWNFLISQPPTHTLTVGRIWDGEERDSIRLTISLRLFELFEATIIWRSGRLIAHLLKSQSNSQFLLTPNPSNAELWLLCVFVNVKRAIRKN